MVFPKATGLLIDRVLQHHRAESAAALRPRGGGRRSSARWPERLRIRFNNTFEQKVILDLRRDLYTTLQRLPLRWYDQRATGDIITRVIDDVTAMERVLIDGVEQGIISVLQDRRGRRYHFQSERAAGGWMLLADAVASRGVLWYTMTARHRYRTSAARPRR